MPELARQRIDRQGRALIDMGLPSLNAVLDARRVVVAGYSRK